MSSSILMVSGGSGSIHLAHMQKNCVCYHLFSISRVSMLYCYTFTTKLYELNAFYVNIWNPDAWNYFDKMVTNAIFLHALL